MQGGFPGVFGAGGAQRDNETMKYEINYLNSGDIYIVKTTGNMTGDDFVSMAEELLNHSEWQKNNNVLFDHQNLNFDNTSLEDIDKIRNFHKKNEDRIGNGKSAIVVKSGLLSEWNKLWSQGEKIKTGNIVKIFDDYNNAIHWIREK